MCSAYSFTQSSYLKMQKDINYLTVFHMCIVLCTKCGASEVSVGGNSCNCPPTAIFRSHRRMRCYKSEGSEFSLVVSSRGFKSERTGQSRLPTPPPSIDLLLVAIKPKAEQKDIKSAKPAAIIGSETQLQYKCFGAQCLRGPELQNMMILYRGYASRMLDIPAVLLSL